MASDAALVAITTAVPLTITAIGGILVSLRNSRKLAVVSERTEVVAGTTTTLADKVDVLHELSNSNVEAMRSLLREQTAKLTEAYAQIAQLQRTIGKMVERLAQRPGSDPQPTSKLSPPDPPPPPVP